MRLCRVIVAALICLALLVSLAPAGPVAAAHKDHCCKKDGGASTGDGGGGATRDHRGCDGSTCAMQCCRVIPVQGDQVPRVAGQTQLSLPLAVTPPPALHSLTEPDRIFHPPRA